MRRPYLLFLSVLLPVRLTLQSGQSFSGRLLEYDRESIVYERYAKDGSLMKCRAKKEQVGRLRLSDPVELRELAEKTYRRGPARKRALARGKELWDVYSWQTNWPGAGEAPSFAYGKLLFNCGLYREAKKYFSLCPEKDKAAVFLGICHWKTGDRGKARAVLDKIDWRKEDEEGAALWHYYMGRLEYEAGDLKNALFHLLPPPMFFPLRRKEGADCLLLAGVCALRENDRGLAERLAGILTNEYREAEFRRQRALALKWLGMRGRYTKTNLLNAYTEELLP